MAQKDIITPKPALATPYVKWLHGLGRLHEAASAD